MNSSPDIFSRLFRHSSSRLRRTWSYSLAAALIGLQMANAAATADAQGTGASQDTQDLARMSLEELGSIIVTSVSKKPEPLSDAAASIYVITRDDIRRSGATSLPEALRLAPNLQVARISAVGYAISARGFNSTAANKLLVLIDGRSVYSPLFSGVFWDAQDVMLEDIERIEVISGPGGTLWGVNAVNGVINVITRSAKNTQGGLLAVGAGNQENDSSLRYGGAIGSADGSGNNGNYRVYAKTFDRDNTSTAAGSPVNDGWHRSQAGFRADWGSIGGGANDSFSLQGNVYRGAEGQPAPGEISVNGLNIPLGSVLISGANLSAHWERRLNDGSSLSVLSYYDRTVRTVTPTFADTLDTLDLQVQQSLQAVGMHMITWGGEYRYGADSLINSPYVAFLPARLNQSSSSIFAQDEMALRDNLKLTVGARVERNGYTGNAFLPSLRLAWKLNGNNMLWSALSRTIRAPSRLDHDTFVPGVPPYQLAGGPEVASEVARVGEIGYRAQPSDRFSYSVTAFHSLYDHLNDVAIVPTGPYAVFASNAEGTTSGIEMWGNYQVAQTWRLSAGLTALKEALRLYPGIPLQIASLAQGADPAQSWHLRSSFDLPARTELDVTVRHVSALSNPVVPAYTAVDCNIGWKPRDNLEFSVAAQNIFGNGHGEFTNVATRSEFGRTVFFKFVGRF